MKSTTPSTLCRQLIFSMMLVLVVPLSACSQNLGSAPAKLMREPCQIDSRLPGVWVSSRGSRMGPSKMTFRFGCDCTYESRTRVLLLTIREKGDYWTQDGQLLLTRAAGETTSWPLSFEADELVLEEYEDETHRYKRKRQQTCSKTP